MTVGKAILEAAQHELGVHEEPMGSNNGKRVREYQSCTWLAPPKPGQQGWPWCVAFAFGFIVFKQVLQRPNPYPTAAVEQLETWARRNGWAIPVEKVKPGDLCCLNHGQHVTIYARPRVNLPGWFVGLGGNQSDRVQYSDYRLSSVTTCIRVPPRVGIANTPKPPRYEVVRGEGEKAKVIFTGNLGKAQRVIGNALRAGARVVRIRRK